MDVKLDKQTFKALSNEKRTEIMKFLGRRRYMQSELAEILNLSVPTVKEHLSALEKAGLIERHEEGRKWKYFSLTKKGKAVLHPEEMNILIVLSLLGLSVAGGIITTLRTVIPAPMAEAVAMESAMMDAQAETLASVPRATEIAASGVPWTMIFGTATVLLIFILTFLLIKRASYKRQLGKALTKK